MSPTCILLSFREKHLLLEGDNNSGKKSSQLKLFASAAEKKKKKETAGRKNINHEEEAERNDNDDDDIGSTNKIAFPNLVVLNISHNKITSLSGIEALVAQPTGEEGLGRRRPLAGGGTLKTLLASDNMISDIQPLSHFCFLETLVLSHNPLCQVPMEEAQSEDEEGKLKERGAFHRGRKAEGDEMDDGTADSDGGHQEPEVLIHDGIFSNLRHSSATLRKLSLSECNIQYLPTKGNCHFPLVTELRLARNHLKEIPKGGIVFRSLKILDLAHNKISWASQDSASSSSSLRFLRPFKYLEQLTLVGNSFVQEQFSNNPDDDSLVTDEAQQKKSADIKNVNKKSSISKSSVGGEEVGFFEDTKGESSKDKKEDGAKSHPPNTSSSYVQNPSFIYALSQVLHHIQRVDGKPFHCFDQDELKRERRRQLLLSQSDTADEGETKKRKSGKEDRQLLEKRKKKRNWEKEEENEGQVIELKVEQPAAQNLIRRQVFHSTGNKEKLSQQDGAAVGMKKQQPKKTTVPQVSNSSPDKFFLQQKEMGKTLGAASGGW